MRSQPLWRNRDFTILWSGQAVSTLGSSISQIALPLLVLALTHSPAQAGLLGALQFVPYLLLSLPAGVLLDRWNRKTVMLLCDAGRALALGSLPLVVLVVGQPLTLLHIYLVAVTDGTFFVFFNLAESSALPHVVPAPQVAAATAQNHVREATSVLVGPPLGTLLFTLGQTVPFLADAISYLASVVSLAFIRTHFQVRRSAHRGHDGAKPRHLGAELREGVTFLAHHRLLRTLAFLTAGIVFVGSSQPLIVILAAQQQHVPTARIGLIFTCGGLGFILGSLLSTPLAQRLRFGRVISGTQWAWAALYVLFAAVLRWPPPALGPFPARGPLPAIGPIAGAVWGLAAVYTGLQVVLPIFNVSNFSYRLALVPDHLQARVLSVYRLFGWGVVPLGQLAAGALLQTVNVVATVAILALVQLVIAASVTRSAPLRQAPALASLASCARESHD
jgi:predicted MFS family arabinose efflux permease